MLWILTVIAVLMLFSVQIREGITWTVRTFVALSPIKRLVTLWIFAAVLLFPLVWANFTYEVWWVWVCDCIAVVLGICLLVATMIIAED